ncbi:MAG: phospholipase D-like domain-containing protein [Candidatus Latescibacteria bacterium]|nr:phospholipase D-like domain-containing protein [Candidatus Latescibacterota bacterium]
MKTPLAALLLLAIATTSPAASPPAAGSMQLVESVPAETVLDQPDLPEARDVWPAMIASARSTLDIEVFYISADPARDDALDAVLAEVSAASARGVRVRLLADRGFHKTYPEWIDAIGGLAGAEVRLLDARRLWGGVQHAKFFVVDGRDCFVGSQNWDYRALEHIRELGARFASPAVAAAVGAVFAHDWALAGDEPPPAATVGAGPWTLETGGGATSTVRFAASPPQALPPGVPHDEPLLVDLIDRAAHEVRLHLLSYGVTERDGTYYATLDAALRRAAARGVQVKVILSNWAKRASALPHIKSLAVLDNVEVRFTNIPQWSGGFIPFARVEHPKYLVKDGDEAWLGTANWGRDYFHESRNLSFFFAAGPVAGDMARWFDTSWNSPYAEVVDPCAEYAPPPRGE